VEGARSPSRPHRRAQTAHRKIFSERFEREAKAIAALNHPNICTLHDVGPNYLVMEYIEGTPLKGPLPVDQALKYAVQICDALDAAHKKGITHRDLKPANILVTEAGIKLLDFGLAKLGTSAIGQAASLAAVVPGSDCRSGASAARRTLSARGGRRLLRAAGRDAAKRHGCSGSGPGHPGSVTGIVSVDENT
jgi:serine/threonine protein kinase